MKSFLVIGEECKDIFVYGKADRLSPEAPVPVFNPIYTNINRGMAGNVIENLLALHANNPVAVFECTSTSDELIKKRYVDEKTNHIFLRVDSGEQATPLELDDILLKMIGTADCMIVSDYNKGYLTDETIENILIYSPDKQVKIIDSKRILTPAILDNADFVKMNKAEYERNHFIWGDRLLQYKHKLLITMGGDGTQFNNKIYPVNRRQTIDVSGAGDTFVAAFAFHYMDTHDTAASVVFANEMASIVVNKRGVATI